MKKTLQKKATPSKITTANAESDLAPPDPTQAVQACLVGHYPLLWFKYCEITLKNANRSPSRGRETNHHQFPLELGSA